MSVSVCTPREEKLNRILKAYSTEEQSLILSFLDQKLIGLIGCDLGEMILHITVDPASRQVIDHISKRFSKLTVETDNQGVEFYRACGFKIENLGELYLGTI